MAKKALLMILDGWGIGKHNHGDVIYETPTPFMDHLNATYPHSQLLACGENVGLPEGQMGNSEVGHLNIGAGRIVYQDLVKINRACADGSIMQNPEIVSAYEYAKKNGKGLHLMGLTSTGGVHSSLSTCSNLLALPRNMAWQRILTFTALWTVATPTRRVARALSRNFKAYAMKMVHTLPASLAVSMPWIVTSAGTV